jgi:tetratricopeptide (TPR) repeat protein
VGAAAAAIMIAVVGTFYWYQSQDPLIPMIQASAKEPKRPIEPRLSRFSYGTADRMRGGYESALENTAPWFDWAVATVLEKKGNSPRLQHAQGIAHLVAAANAKGTDGIDVASERRQAEVSLVAAAMRVPNDASYQNDLAAALIWSGDQKKRDLALVHLNKALQLHPNLPEALFNRAIELRDRANALRALRRTATDPIGKKETTEAIAAFNLYLAVDPSSKWAEEAKRDMKSLKENL